MERDDWQKTPGQALGGSGQQSSLIPATRRPSSPPRRPAAPPPSAPSAAPAAPRATKATSATGPATAAATIRVDLERAPGSVIIQSTTSEHPQEHSIRPDAIQYARTVKTMVDVSKDTQTPIEIPYTEEQVRLAAELVNFIAQHMQDTQVLPPQQAVADFIIKYTNKFERLSFVDTLAIINFFDIPAAFDAIVSMRQPLQLPARHPLPQLSTNYDYPLQLPARHPLPQLSTNYALERRFIPPQEQQSTPAAVAMAPASQPASQKGFLGKY
jgi:hypothetical protein